MAEYSTSGPARAWRRLGTVTQVFGGRDDQRQFWQTTSRAGRITIALAIFALFASLGFLADVVALGRSSPQRLVLVSLLSGGGALAYAVVAFTLAGHLPILCWRAGSGEVEELVVGQVPLGILPGRSFEASRTNCAAGDVLLVLTDGLTEVFDAADDEFGMERVKAVFATHARKPLAEIELKLLAAARAHGTPHDDQSLVLIRRVA